MPQKWKQSFTPIQSSSLPYPVIRPSSWPRPLYSNYFKTNSSCCLTRHDTHLTLGVRNSQGNFAYSSRISFGIVCCHCLAKKAITKQNRLCDCCALLLFCNYYYSMQTLQKDDTQIDFPQCCDTTTPMTLQHYDYVTL